MSAPKLDISRETHVFLAALAGLVVAFFVWSAVGRLDVVSLAAGNVVPSSQVKTVQHLEGGIVDSIMVKEGDTVEVGQALVALESTASGADVQELNVRITSLTADVARLIAEVEQADAPVFPDGFAEQHPDLVSQVLELFDTRREQLVNDMDSQRSLVTQRRRERDEIAARLTNNKKTLVLLEEQVTISEELLKENLTNRMLHLNLLKEAASLKGIINEDSAALERLTSAIEQEELKLEAISGRFRVTSRQELEEKRRSLEEFTNRARKYQDSFKRAVLVSPVNGVVMTLHVVTRGGVVRPGGNVVDIVPSGDAMVVEAKLPPQDVGFVFVGQQAKVRLASSEGARFDALDGKVVQVSPDTVETKDGAPYYKVRIETDNAYFESQGERYQMVPGVQVMCSIVTGSRSVLEYFASPLLGGIDTALQER